MIEAEARWIQQEKQIIETETKSHHQKHAAIKAEQQAVETERKAIAEELMTARYENVF